MIKKKRILLAVHLNVAYPLFLINTLQSRSLFTFLFLGCPMMELTNHSAHHLPNNYLHQPWRLWSYRFSKKQKTIFFFLPVDSSPDTMEDAQLRGVCVHAADGCQSNVRGTGVILQKRHHCGERHRGRGGEDLISLSHLLLLSVSLSSYHAPPDFLFSAHFLVRLMWITFVIALTLDFKWCLPSWKSDVLLLIVCQCPYQSSAINPCFFFLFCFFFFPTLGREKKKVLLKYTKYTWLYTVNTSDFRGRREKTQRYVNRFFSV